jgi:hypothetical protein
MLRESVASHFSLTNDQSRLITQRLDSYFTQNSSYDEQAA